MLIAFIAAYLLGSIALGLFAARRVHSTADYAVAGALAAAVTWSWRPGLPPGLVLSWCWGFRPSSCKRAWAVWWEDPFGAGMCLVLVGLFFRL